MINTATKYLVATLAVVVITLQAGCMGMRGTHKKIHPETGVISKTTFTYLRGGSQNIADLNARAPEGWVFSFDKSESQELDTGAVTDIVLGVLEEEDVPTE